MLNQRPRHSPKDELAQLAMSKTADHEELGMPASGRLRQLYGGWPRTISDHFKIRNDAVPGQLACAVSKLFTGRSTTLGDSKNNDILRLFEDGQSKGETPCCLGGLLPTDDNGATVTPRR